MPWLNHPSYRPVRDKLISRFRNNLYVFKRIRPIVFLCGGKESNRRQRVAEYLRKHTESLVFFADDVWFQLAGRRDLNALQMEAELADLADVLIIVVESPGTFAELGAFALNEALRAKLLPVLDVSYKDEPSFINSGPVRWVNETSQFGPTLYGNFDVILDCAPDIEERLKRIPVPKPSIIKGIDLKCSKKHRLMFLSDLIGVIGPVTEQHIEFYVDHILGSGPGVSLTSLLSLAFSLGILFKKDANNVGQVYFRPSNQEWFGVALATKPFSMSVERAKILGTIQRIDTAIDALGVIEEPSRAA